MSVGTREQWLAARAELLREEKELTRRSDALARRRQALPWVPVEKAYEFRTPEGTRTLADLFAGRSQLIVYHLMMGPDWTEACEGCSFTADTFERAVGHLEDHGVTFVAVSRTPLERLEAYKRRMGWTFTWVSCLDGDFNRDLAAFGPEEYRDMELHGVSAFALEDGTVYHTYSTYDRGTDALNATWQLLDRAPRGREGQPEGWPRRRYEHA
jgi:predicted dithiol-disulfide oxidoreductase (DUF899 family)